MLEIWSKQQIKSNQTVCQLSDFLVYLQSTPEARSSFLTCFVSLEIAFLQEKLLQTLSRINKRWAWVVLFSIIPSLALWWSLISEILPPLVTDVTHVQGDVRDLEGVSCLWILASKIWYCHSIGTRACSSKHVTNLCHILWSSPPQLFPTKSSSLDSDIMQHDGRVFDTPKNDILGAKKHYQSINSDENDHIFYPHKNKLGYLDLP